MIKFFTVFIGVFFLVFTFQNCSRNYLTPTRGMLNQSSFSEYQTNEKTNLNTSIEFTLNHNKSVQDVELVVSPSAGTQLHGTITVLDAANFKLRYEPNFGFRGVDKIVVTVKDSYGHNVDLKASITVGNSVVDLEPALAIRGIGCIECHANIGSNIITDFGYKGDGNGRDYFFNQNLGKSWYTQGVYTGRQGIDANGKIMQDLTSLQIPKDNSISVFVPKNADISSKIAPGTAVQASNLADFIREALKLKTSNKVEQDNYSKSVVEKDSIYIGAPTDNDLISSFHLKDSDRYKYYKDSDTSDDLKGLTDKVNYFKTEDSVQCDGDLVLRGPLLINNLNLKTVNGCRLYVIGSVFIYGPINYSNSEPSRNIQITSTRGIFLGLGYLKKDGVFCDNDHNVRWVKDEINNTKNPAYTSKSSLQIRLVDVGFVKSFEVRQSSHPKKFGQSILDESVLIEKKEGTLYDATCRAETRNVSYERVLLNAPTVQGRYIGDFKGTVIAEYSIMSLGKFKFEFDKVFKSVPILPFIDSSLYLEVK